MPKYHVIRPNSEVKLHALYPTCRRWIDALTLSCFSRLMLEERVFAAVLFVVCLGFRTGAHGETKTGETCHDLAASPLRVIAGVCIQFL